MKRFILCLAVSAGLMTGCSETQAVTTAAGLSGTYDLTVVGNYVFVTSSDRNELRVLDLDESPRDFVRAPNPLEPLSIPVLERPTYLTRDVFYRVVEGPEQDEAGKPLPRGSERHGPYVYARSDGAQQISVIAAAASDDRNLRELHRLGKEEGEELGFVTAFAARGPGQEGAGSILYYATQNATVATLWRQPLPAPESLDQDSTPPPRTLVMEMPGETVDALLVLPSVASTDAADPRELEHVVVATRGIQGAVGRTFRLDAVRPQSPVVNYAFPAPVRLLATHPVVDDTYWEGDLDRQVSERTIKACGIDRDERPIDPADPNGPKESILVQPQRRTLVAGEYVFGVLDESTCGGGTQCAGVLAVDSATGQVLNDATGARMLPIRPAAGLPTGLTLIPDVPLATRCADVENHLVPRPLVGVIPSSDGQISLFDAVKLRSFDLNPDAAAVSASTVTNAAGANLIGDQNVRDYVTGGVQNGATRSDTYRIVYEGSLPSPRDPLIPEGACTDAGCTFKVGSPREARFVLVNDLVVLEPGTPVCEQPVIARQEVAGGVEVSTGPLPEDCKGRQRFSLRASRSSGKPFVVYSDGRGTEGRIAPGESLTLEGDYYFHPPFFNSQEPPFLVRLELKRTVDVSARGDQYLVSVQSNFSPYVFSPDTASLAAGLTAYRLPGPVAHTRFKGATLAYIAYPSADGILQVNMASITDSGAQSVGLVPFQ